MSVLKKAANRLLFEWQRNVTSIPKRNFSINLVTAFLKNKKAIGTKRLGNINIDKHAEDLKENGYTKFGIVLNEQEINGLKQYLKDLPVYNTYKPQDRFTMDSVPEDCHVASFDEQNLVKNELILDLVNDESLLEIARRTLGATPTVSEVGGWWSFAGKKKAKDAQLFHRDVDDFKFLKLFIYLTDVTKDTGPHIYVAKSHNKNLATKLKRYTDEEVDTLLGKENVLSFEEPKGSVFLVNTYGMHKGLLPVTDNRLLIQIEYSTLPLYVRKYAPVKLNRDVSKLDPYVNRLIVDFK
ncbi:phytanoyl-CoA dioxygenase family protein [Taibaiella chishuiensis]|uniref:Phytanoyl-CoA dioxygenase PhyH n=1 Tax=Taibaiella chishuiensis TaxID=1434707 RepID=A0A2P8DB61_9BACT|nr:phytanoyl-CoA dioxygenase family protein [Taibaiella chishuiensis]PSK94454.1 phytanoyl-CoA dioxygenase PhyH [Taibaiella chishuiensis]